MGSKIMFIVIQLTLISIFMDIIDCKSLNLIKDGSNCGTVFENKTKCFSDFQHEVLRILIQNSSFMQDTSAPQDGSEVIYENPCILTKIASFLGYHNIRFISSADHYYKVKFNLKSCAGINDRPITKSLTLIEGNAEDSDHLRQNIGNLLSRDFSCYVVLCSDLCNFFLINLASQMSYVSEFYMWFTFYPPSTSSKTIYPTNQIVISSSVEQFRNDTYSFEVPSNRHLRFQYFTGLTAGARFEMIYSNYTKNYDFPYNLLSKFPISATRPLLHVTMLLGSPAQDT